MTIHIAHEWIIPVIVISIIIWVGSGLIGEWLMVKSDRGYYSPICYDENRRMIRQRLLYSIGGLGGFFAGLLQWLLTIKDDKK